MPSRNGLMAFAAVHPVPSEGPRHIRQVPIRSCEGSRGSIKNGAGVVIVRPSPDTSAFPITGDAPNASGVQLSDCEQRYIDTPALAFAYQFSGIASPIATELPSPARICGHVLLGFELFLIPATPLTPRPTIMSKGELPV